MMGTIKRTINRAKGGNRDGWIDWESGSAEAPVPDGTLVDVKLRNGKVHYRNPVNVVEERFVAHYAYWRTNGAAADIVAYRLSDTGEDERVTLKPGDYVSTEGMAEEQYHAVARAFMEAGADGSKGYFYHLKHDVSYLGWDKRDDELWGCGYKPLGFTGRHLTIDQVLNATNAANTGGATRPVNNGVGYPAEELSSALIAMDNPITTLKQARTTRDEAEQAYQQALAEAREYLGGGGLS